MLKAATLAFAFLFATASFAQEPADTMSEMSLVEQDMLLSMSCDMSKLLLSYPDLTKEDKKRYESLLNFCLRTRLYNKQLQELSGAIRSAAMEIDSLREENAALKRKLEPKVAAAPEPKAAPRQETKLASVAEVEPPGGPAFGPGERVPLPKKGPARNSATGLPDVAKKRAPSIAAPTSFPNRWSETMSSMQSPLRHDAN